MPSNDAKFTISVFCIVFFLLLFTLGFLALPLLGESTLEFWVSFYSTMLNIWAMLCFGLFYIIFMLIFYLSPQYRQEHPYFRFVGLCIICLSSPYLVGAYDIFLREIRVYAGIIFIFHSAVAISAMTLGLTVFAFITQKVITLGRGAGIISLIAIIITLSFLPYYLPDFWGYAVALGVLSIIYGLYLVVNIVRIMGKYENEIGDEYATGAIYIHFDLILLLILILIAIPVFLCWCCMMAGSRQSTPTPTTEYVLIKRSDLEKLI